MPSNGSPGGIRMADASLADASHADADVQRLSSQQGPERRRRRFSITTAAVPGGGAGVIDRPTTMKPGISEKCAAWQYRTPPPLAYPRPTLLSTCTVAPALDVPHATLHMQILRVADV